MRPHLALAAALCLVAYPAVAASPPVEAAIKTLAKIEADPAKFQTFCKINRELGALTDTDAAKAEALEKQMDALLTSMGRDVVEAWDIGSELDPTSEDGKAFDAALDAIEDKCGN